MKVVLFGALLSILAYIISQNSLILRHWLVLLTFGKIPGLKTYGSSCDSTPISNAPSTRLIKYKHCFDEAGELRTVDANHNETFMREVLMEAVKMRCPILISKPFADHKCYERLRDVASADKEMSVRVKENIPILMNNQSWFPT